MQNYVVRNDVWINKAQELFNLQESIKRLEQQASIVKEELSKLSKNKPSCGGGFIYEMIPRKGSVDYAKVPQLQGVDLDQYRKEDVVMWRLKKEAPKVTPQHIQELIDLLYPSRK